MAKKLYEESNIAAIAEKIRSRTGGDKKYTATEMADGVDEAAEAAAEEKEAITRGLIERNLTEIVIPKGVKEIGPYALAGLSKCRIYDFSNFDSVPPLSYEGFLGGCYGKILVPYNLRAEWPSATNWSQFKDYIVPVYDAPEIVDPGDVSEGLEYSFNGNYYEVIGRGSCLDSIIVIPETYNDGINGEHAVKYISGYTTEDYESIGAFMNDQTIEEIILPESGSSIDWYAFNGSSLKVVRNYSCGTSFWSSGLALEYVSFIDGVGIVMYEFYEVNCALTLDFSRHTSVPVLADTYFLEIHPDLKILVPIDLYDEWIVSTNWTEYAEYIVAVK